MEKMRNKDSQEQAITLGDLRNKQSVRTTFRLSEEMIDLLGLIAGQFGIKQKSLLDQLIEESVSERDFIKRDDNSTVARGKKRPKTYVISRNALKNINLEARRKNIPRDTIVEQSIKRLKPLVTAEKEKQKNRKIILGEMEGLLATTDRLMERANTVLKRDDEVMELMYKLADTTNKTYATFKTIVERGAAMEDWPS